MKGVLPWLVNLTCHAGTIDLFPALSALIIPIQILAVMLGRLSMFLYSLLVLPVMKEERHREEGHNDVVELS